MLKIYDVLTPFNYSQVNSVVAENIGEAEDLFLKEYPMTKIIKITLHSEYVITKEKLKALEGETTLDPEIEQEQAEGRKLQEMYFKVDGEISKLLSEFANTRIKERGNGRNWLLRLRERIKTPMEKE